MGKLKIHYNSNLNSQKASHTFLPVQANCGLPVVTILLKYCYDQLRVKCKFYCTGASFVNWNSCNDDGFVNLSFLSLNDFCCVHVYLNIVNASLFYHWMILYCTYVVDCLLYWLFSISLVRSLFCIWFREEKWDTLQLFMYNTGVYVSEPEKYQWVVLYSASHFQYSVPEGFYFSGDGAKRDDNGFYHITGRMDDIINVTGHRLGTAEIEDVIVSQCCSWLLL